MVRRQGKCWTEEISEINKDVMTLMLADKYLNANCNGYWLRLSSCCRKRLHGKSKYCAGGLHCNLPVTGSDNNY